MDDYDEKHTPLTPLKIKDAENGTVSHDDDDDDDDEHEKITLSQYLMSIIFMPRSMQILCLTNLLSWMAHLSYSLYFTDFVGETVFRGNPAVR